MTLREIEQKLWSMTEESTKKWFDEQMRNPFGRFYLYYKPLGEHLIIATEQPEGYQLANPERISPAWTLEQAQYRVRNMLNRLPLFQ